MDIIFDYLFIFARLSIAAVFVVSSLGKLRDFTTFEKTIVQFQLLPPSLHRAAGITIIGIELVVVALTALGNNAAVVGLLLASVLLTGFTAALVSVLHRRINTPCNCFGPTTKPVIPHDIGRNAGFILCALLGSAAALGGQHSAVPIVGVFFIGLGAIVFVLVWMNFPEIARFLQ